MTDTAPPKKPNERQRKFAEYYHASGNATDAAKRAGYSEKWAASNIDKLLKSTTVIAQVQSLAIAHAAPTIATAQERREVLTKILRGEEQAPYVTREGLADGAPDHAARVKAAELLAKMDGDLAPIKLDITARVQSVAQVWVAQVLSVIEQEAGTDAAQRILQRLPVLELEGK